MGWLSTPNPIEYQGGIVCAYLRLLNYRKSPWTERHLFPDGMEEPLAEPGKQSLATATPTITGATWLTFTRERPPAGTLTIVIRSWWSQPAVVLWRPIKKSGRSVSAMWCTSRTASGTGMAQ